jgi:hypothetical protein
MRWPSHSHQQPLSHRQWFETGLHLDFAAAQLLARNSEVELEYQSREMEALFCIADT